MTTILRWPDGRGRFVDRDTDRAPVENGPLTVTAGSTIEVDDDDTVDHYLTRGFERVESDGADGDADGAEDDAGEPTDDGEDGDTDEADGDSFDVESFVDRTPVSDVVDDIAAGDADGHLDAVAEADGRVSVDQAVEDRKAEIGGE